MILSPNKLKFVVRSYLFLFIGEGFKPKFFFLENWTINWTTKLLTCDSFLNFFWVVEDLWFFMKILASTKKIKNRLFLNRCVREYFQQHVYISQKGKQKISLTVFIKSWTCVQPSKKISRKIIIALHNCFKSIRKSRRKMLRSYISIL